MTCRAHKMSDVPPDIAEFRRRKKPGNSHDMTYECYDICVRTILVQQRRCQFYYIIIIL